MENNYTNYHTGDQVTVHDGDGSILVHGIITKMGSFHASVVDTDGESYDVTYGMLRKAVLVKTAENEVIKEEEQDGKKYILSKSEKNVDGSITVCYEVTVDNKQIWKSEDVVTNVYDFENGWSAPDDFDDNKLDLIQQTAESGFDMIIQSYENVVNLIKQDIAPGAPGDGLAESAPKGKPAFSPDAPKLEAEQGEAGGGAGGGDVGGGEPMPDGEGGEEPAPEAEGEAPKEEGPGAGGVEPFAQQPAETATAASLERPSLARSVLSSKTGDDRLHNNPQHRLDPILRSEMEHRGIDSGNTNDLELSQKLKGFDYGGAPKKSATERIAEKLNNLK